MIGRPRQDERGGGRLNRAKLIRERGAGPINFGCQLSILIVL